MKVLNVGVEETTLNPLGSLPFVPISSVEFQFFDDLLLPS